MIASSAKSRVSANRNITINMALNERRNHLPYVVAAVGSEFEDSDGNVLLHQIFVRRMQLDSGKPTSKAPQHLTAVFGKPARSGTLNMWQCRALKAYLERTAPPLNEPEVFHNDAALENIPKSCIKWASYTPEAAAVNGSFTVISNTMRRSNSTRNSSMVMYTVVVDDGSESSVFGEVLFFFTVDVVNGGRACHGDGVVDEQKLYLAYLQQFLVQADERLLYRSGLGLKVVIEARSILELIGLIKDGDTQYIIRRHGCLF